MGKKYISHNTKSPITEKVSDTIIRLPFYVDLDQTDLDHIVNTIKTFKS